MPLYEICSLSSPTSRRSELTLAVADIVAESMLRILDLDRSLRPVSQLSLAGVSWLIACYLHSKLSTLSSCRLTRHEFCLAAVVQKLAPPAEADKF